MGKKQRENLKTMLIAQIIFNANDTTMSVNECANFLNMHPNTVKTHIRQKKIIISYSEGKICIPKVQFIDKLIANLLDNEKKALKIMEAFKVVELSNKKN